MTHGHTGVSSHPAKPDPQRVREHQLRLVQATVTRQLRATLRAKANARQAAAAEERARADLARIIDEAAAVIQ